MVEPAVGALNHLLRETEWGAGVAVVAVGVGVVVCVGVTVGVGVIVGVGVTVGVGVGFCTLTLMTSRIVEPFVPYTVAVKVCVPFANLVVSRTHCVPSAGVLSVLTAWPSMSNTTRFTLPEVLA